MAYMERNASKAVNRGNQIRNTNQNIFIITETSDTFSWHPPHDSLLKTVSFTDSGAIYVR
jgi:hypothetical protein